jgi:hypothetical protein
VDRIESEVVVAHYKALFALRYGVINTPAVIRTAYSPNKNQALNQCSRECTVGSNHVSVFVNIYHVLQDVNDNDDDNNNNISNM